MDEKGIVNGYVTRRSTNDRTARQHAINYAAGVAIISLCVYVLAWSVIKPFWEGLPSWTILFCLPVALIVGSCWGSIKLMQFTEEHRNWIYWVEEATGFDLDQDGIVGMPAEESEARGYTFLLGADRVLHRLNVDVTLAEIDSVKRSLLLSEKATVRSLTAIVGDRASRLRDELIALGICEMPRRDNAAAMLSTAGREAVVRW